jgi:hypothetical protein
MEKKDVSEKDAKRLKEAVCQLSKLVSNSVCADCHQQRSLWASVNFGVFLCSRCAGMHRHLGVHITQVRSINLDTWTPIQLLSVIINGNMWTNSWLLSNKSPDYGRHILDDPSMSRFIQEKYEGLRYGDNSGIMLVTKTNFPYITVDKALEVFKLAMTLHRQQIDHCLIRPQLIKAAGFDYAVPTHNPGNRKLLLLMEDSSSGDPKSITQAHISGIPQSRGLNRNTFPQPTPATQSVSESNIRVANFIDIGDFGVPKGVGDSIEGIARMNLFDDVGQRTWNAPSKSASFGALPHDINSEPAWPTTTTTNASSGDKFASFFQEPLGRLPTTPPKSSTSIDLFGLNNSPDLNIWSNNVAAASSPIGFFPTFNSTSYEKYSDNNGKKESNGGSLNGSLILENVFGSPSPPSASTPSTSNGLGDLIVPPLTPTPFVHNATSPSPTMGNATKQANGDPAQDKDFILSLFSNK